MRASCAAQISVLLCLATAALTCVEAVLWKDGRGKAFHKNTANDVCDISRRIKCAFTVVESNVARIPGQQEKARKALQETKENLEYLKTFRNTTKWEELSEELRREIEKRFNQTQEEYNKLYDVFNGLSETIKKFKSEGEETVRKAKNEAENIDDFIIYSLFTKYGSSFCVGDGVDKYVSRSSVFDCNFYKRPKPMVRENCLPTQLPSNPPMEGTKSSVGCDLTSRQTAGKGIYYGNILVEYHNGTSDVNVSWSESIDGSKKPLTDIRKGYEENVKTASAVDSVFRLIDYLRTNVAEVRRLVEGASLPPSPALPASMLLLLYYTLF
ncbi:hypothetical protein, conserved in T.vivax [Trypanosoma vivax Y486]|uniref:Uncharacterized protein n=1 Tax=Trypanosoma vivax (strain Y486) TaxID=1055687 RepID=F9WPU4_TRYVY|nr:hypothetical protein, conserved in T.vivax [Trypanosoma vivax Y486]|eukprot:CCD19571.1 hypothetical protein, conserved in T.vivax [Trypanosoma vivax Y486]